MVNTLSQILSINILSYVVSNGFAYKNNVYNSLVCTPDVISYILFCQQTLVAETCANLLRFTLPITTGPTASAGDTSGLHTIRDHYHPERLPYALVARLEGLAQYAPSALHSLYLDAYSGTDGVRSGLSGVGISTYGVFDGLDYQNLYVPASPPRKSPHKVHNDVYTGSSGRNDNDSNAYGFSGLDETEKDEF